MSTRIATTAKDLKEAAEQIRASSVVYLDTEFHAERRYLPKLYLVQVLVEGGTVWILDPLTQGTIDAVREPLLETPWILHAGHQDMRVMLRVLGDLPERILDVQLAHGLLSTEFPAPLGRLAVAHLGAPIDKSATLTDWSRRPLSPEQLHYAAQDVLLLPALWERLQAALAVRGRVELHSAACAQARSAVLDPPDPALAWEEVQGVEHLTPQQAMVAAELALWRREVAEDEDTPERSVLSDGLLNELSRSQPASVAALHANRRFPKRVIQRHGAALVDRIQRAAHRPQWGWPQMVTPGTHAALRFHWLETFALALGLRDQWAVRLVMPPDIVRQACFCTDPTALSSRLGWRAPLLQPGLGEALRGSRTLAFDGAISTRDPHEQNISNESDGSTGS
ncbi:MAG: HRDC domain-containing protein [Deltaproteobacteria bacterium]|nr:HRDC domain-containing protein [Deltaproteobacteria bacterium]